MLKSFEVPQIFLEQVTKRTHKIMFTLKTISAHERKKYTNAYFALELVCGSDIFVGFLEGVWILTFMILTRNFCAWAKTRDGS